MPGDDPCTTTIEILAATHAHLWRYNARITDNPCTLYKAGFSDEHFGVFVLGLKSGLDTALSEIKATALAIEAHGIQQALQLFDSYSAPGASTGRSDPTTSSPSSANGTAWARSPTPTSEPPPSQLSFSPSPSSSSPSSPDPTPTPRQAAEKGG